MTNKDYDDTYDKSSYTIEDTYSKYPTKDKKYECRTGPLEGFFTSSVEFCKIKIGQGPQGPQGPAGPARSTRYQGTRYSRSSYKVRGPAGANSTSQVHKVHQELMEPMERDKVHTRYYFSK